MFAVSLSSLLSTVTSQPYALTVSYILLTLGVITLLCSSYRYLLVYLIGGMFYGLIVEVIQSGLIHTFTIDHWHGYIAALAITWSLGAWFIYRRYLVTTSGLAKIEVEVDDYIEHTPIYTNYSPRFPS